MKIIEAKEQAVGTKPALSIGDGVASLIGLIAAVAVYAKLSDWNWPALGSYRSATAVLTGLGLAMCIAGGMRVLKSMQGAFFKFASVLGFAALSLSIVGIITGTREAFVALAVTMFVLWVSTTASHALHKA